MALEPEVIPAILAKTREELLRRVGQVAGIVYEIQIDVMDGKFVPNRTVGLEDLIHLPDPQNFNPKARYEFHWMVKDPEKWIERIKGPYMHLVHVETITSEQTIQKIGAIVKKSGGEFGFAINPETGLEKLLPLLQHTKAKRVLVMTVHPGFSGQKYLFEMGEKIQQLRRQFPSLDIEVDGGVNSETIHHAYVSGANLLAAASAIFSSGANNIQDAIADLKKHALSGSSGSPNPAGSIHSSNSPHSLRSHNSSGGSDEK